MPLSSHAKGRLNATAELMPFALQGVGLLGGEGGGARLEDARGAGRCGDFALASSWYLEVMGATTLFVTKMSPVEYPDWERGQRQKHQLLAGEVYAMAGGSPRHNHLCANVLRELGAKLRGGPCRAFTSDQQVHIPVNGNYVYPDATVICGAVQLHEKSDAALNPSVIVEVLSKNTEQHDRGDKWKDYQTIGALTDYVLVSQRMPRIEHFRRDVEGGWTYRVAGPGGRLELSTGTVVIVDDVYEGAFDLPGDD